MISYSLIPDSAYANLPEDPEARFLLLADIMRENYISVVEGTDDARAPFSPKEWYQQYVHELLAAADTCGISGLVAADVALGTPNGDTKFDATLTRVLTRLRLKLWTVKRADSVAISAATKQDIRNELEALRELVNGSNLSASMKESLHKRIDAVEAELDKPRSSLNPTYALCGMLAFLQSAPGIMADLPDAIENTTAYAAKAGKLGQSIMGRFGAEKAYEIREEDRLTNRDAPRIGHQPMKQLMDKRPGTELTAMPNPRPAGR